MNQDRRNKSVAARLILVSCLASTLSSVPLPAQNAVLLRRGDTFNVINEKVREVIGNVEFQQGDVIVTCDKAVQYLDENRVEARGNVRVVQDTVTLLAPHGFYDGNTRTAYGDGGVTLNNRHMTIKADSGIYATERKTAWFNRNVMVVDSTSVLLSRTATYDQTLHRAECRGDVKIRSTTDNTVVYGDSLEHFDSTRITRIMQNPRLVKIDTAGGTVDTLIIESTLMESFEEPVKRFVASGDVRLCRGDVAARSGTGTYYSGRDSIVLESKPIVWYEENQLTGDTITMTMKDKQLSRVFVRGNAFAVSRGDSLTTTRFNQLTGRDLTMEFAGGKLARMVVEKTATSLYYVYQEGRPDGVNKSSGDTIILRFIDGKLDTIAIPGGPEGTYYPEKMIRGKEADYNLAGFRWLTDRPAFRYIGESVVDLEKDTR